MPSDRVYIRAARIFATLRDGISQELIEQKCFVLFNAWATWNVWIAAGLRSMCECSICI